MKRKFILITLFITSGFCLTGNAQDAEKKDGGLSIGPKGGVSINRYKSSANSTRDGDRTGAVIGGFANISFLRVFSIQPEIFFSQRGGAAYNIDNTTSRYKLSYMEVPILFKVRLPIERTFFPHVFVGPDIAYRIFSNSTNTDGNGNTSDVDNTQIRRIDTGGVLGAGLDVQSKHLFFTVDGRYGFSFSSLGNSNYNLNVNHRSFVVLAGIGYRFCGTK
jgi:hypothetical protein